MRYGVSVFYDDTVTVLNDIYFNVTTKETYEDFKLFRVKSRENNFLSMYTTPSRNEPEVYDMTEDDEEIEFVEFRDYVDISDRNLDAHIKKIAAEHEIFTSALNSFVNSINAKMDVYVYFGYPGQFHYKTKTKVCIKYRIYKY